ncbi:MAG: DNA-3-methyladenine glycosylase I [Bacteroidota bacterium]
MSEFKDERAFEETYCHVAEKLSGLHKEYHDTIYGFPTDSDQELFKRLMLEVNQAGLSWGVVLKKKEGLVKAYDDFDIHLVASYTEEDRERLLQNPAIIRNKLKVNAAIHNARQILKLQEEHGSFQAWLDLHHPKSKEEWVKLFKKTFKFTGGEITKEFLQAVGYLAGAHHPDCPIYEEVKKLKPKWMENIS